MKTAGKNKRSFKKILSGILWIGLGIGFLVLFVAAMKEKNNEKCIKTLIEIDGAEDNLYVERSDIRQMILRDRSADPVGKSLSHINLQSLERTIKKNPWVDKAQLYIDAANCLHINIQQKQPLARIFTVSGYSFYMDTKGGSIPLLDKFSARVPVFTNFPATGQKPYRSDSSLYAQVFAMSNFLTDNPFWNAQIDQANITEDKKFILVPQVGKQVIAFGDGSDIPGKFGKLFAFYRQVLNTQGWQKYDTINIAFSGQVVCTRAKNFSGYNTTKNNKQP